MADDGVPESITSVVQQVIAAIPAGCTWMLPVTGDDGAVTDFRIAATSERVRDIYDRGTQRLQSLLSELYPSMVGGPLWRMYLRVLDSGEPEQFADFQYEEKSAGVVAHSRFAIDVHRVLGGLLVWWQRSDEYQRRLENTELLGNLGWSEYDVVTGRTDWSPGTYRIFGRDPALGPMSRTEQAAAMLAEDRGIAETAWQTLDSGATSDVTVRFRVGAAVKHVRILSDLARDAAGAPVKIYAVVQDVTAREDSRTAIERLGDQLRTREMTALAEHRLALQLQNMIQPVPSEPFGLNGLRAMVGYLPAERALRVGGDWYHAQTLDDGQAVLVVGDVAGHGLDAASGMAHLRFALVAWLSIGIRDPGTLLGHLNRLCSQLALTGTAVVARYDPCSRELTWARGGHMPPLLARSGTAVELRRPPGLLLGADNDACYSVAVELLQADDLVLFYTDGLVERRAGSADERMAQVTAALCQESAAPDADCLSRLRGVLHTASPDDDTCTLAIHVDP
ncbi:PP2C family protein-serine/threonine phosphatase [Actinoplanes friuliensis]|uniref:Putative magnesium/manganese-dependent protein phosphatase n=1 Tax=Actinoplanes friuliensis DSM 7358 TaxID=1246995 RepID=U5VYA4_9ACTN|nr:PP2C family protein-serine/threonine phosphatase [Actinoplanes friuliensis]AGZ40690.1 putative magnesium/manganese-dependent protein phosphatase [Actinoplanes friuliensis DSM 7358]